MGPGVRLVPSFAAVGLAAALALGADPHEGQLPKTSGDALAWSKDLMDAARSARSAATPEIVKGIRRAVDWMQPFVKAESANDNWTAVWNEALTLTRFHGNKPTGEYVMKTEREVFLSIEFGLPVGRNWTFVSKSPGNNEQCWGEITRVTSDGRKAATIAISAYSFNALYSDVGGENATGLAKMSLGYFREKFKKIDSGGTQIVAKPLSKGFPRAQFFEIVGTTAEGPSRLRCYYAKTSIRTLEFDAWQYRDVKGTDTAFEAWHKSVEDPELEAILGTIAEHDPKKTK